MTAWMHSRSRSTVIDWLFTQRASRGKKKVKTIPEHDREQTQLSAKERTTKTVECDRMIQSRPAADNTSYLNRLPVIRSVGGLETWIWKCGPVQSTSGVRMGVGEKLIAGYRNGKEIDGG